MRLYVGVFRHSLPLVSFVFDTQSAPEQVNTISDLLAAVNAVIPLESSDGEWGLEDYIVDIIPKDNKQHAYECLHFSNVRDVLREDDEIQIRGMSSDELRSHRQGGRLQITSDGRHLVDGVAWGKRWRPQLSRPGVNIPPRKRRRLLISEEDGDTSVPEPPLQLMSGAQIGTLLDDEDEDEDEEGSDYEEDEDGGSELEEDDLVEDSQGEDDDDDKENSFLTEQLNNPLQIITRQEFEDADEDEDEEDHESDVEVNEEDEDDFDEEDLQMLLEEAAELQKADQNGAAEIGTPRSKRKRDIEDDGSGERDTTFEGFTSSQHQVDTVLASDGQSATKLGPYPVEVQTNGVKLNGHSSQTAHATSSDGESDSESEDTSDDESTSESRSGGETSSGSDSDSESESGSGRSTSSDDSDASADVVKLIETKLDGVSTKEPVPAKDSEIKPSRSNGAPGTGTTRTRKNNDRMKRRKRLNSLKMAGILPADAGFDALRNYDASHGRQVEAQDDDVVEPPSSSPNAEELRRRKDELIARLNADSEESDVERGEPSDQTQTNAGQITNDSNSAEQNGVVVNEETNVEPPTLTEEILTTTGTTAESKQRRTRLDVESSRRMLFSSLGLRNPKTKAAEDALREKLAQSIRKPQTRPSEAEESTEVENATKSRDENAWKKKLIISAVECIYEGVTIPPPPFPFKQRWQVESEQAEAEDSNQPPPDEEENLGADDQDEWESIDEAEDLSMSNPEPTTTDPSHDQSSAELPTLSAAPIDSDDIPVPDNLNELTPLTEDAIHKDVVIAFKHLHINAKFEPEESSYRVARVIGIQDGIVDIVLSKQFRKQPSPRYDEETGERVYHGLDAPDGEDEEDDGIREVRFEEMIQPRLIRGAEVKVPASTDNITSDKAETQQRDRFSVIPESHPSHQPEQQLTIEQVEISTPRKLEITTMIKDAGFESGLDAQLLEPMAPVMQEQDKGDSPPDIESSGQWISSPTGPEVSTLLEPSQEDTDASNLPVDEVTLPTISIVETVNYPNMSHIGEDTSRLSQNIASSSYQDAQRISPAISDVDHINLLRSQLDGGVDDSQEFHYLDTSLPSEVPQSQNNVGTEASGIPKYPLEEKYSILGLRGGNGQIDGDGTDSDGLPSLFTLTSSQRERTKSHSTQLSPPPLRKDNRVKGKGKAKASQHDFDIKASQSQDQVRLSQVPIEDHSIVDLTLSSEAAEPSDENDIEYAGSSSQQKQRRKATKATRGQSKDKIQANGKATKNVLSSSSGNRRTMTSKKRSAV